MNLSVKSLRQLLVLAVALFFFSCEEETSLLGFKDPDQKFAVKFVEIPLPTSVLSIDSIITDNKGSAPSQIVMVGRVQDPVAGTTTATPYLQVTPTVGPKISGQVIYDSVTFNMRVSYYAYGATANTQEKFTIHEITQDSLNRFASSRYDKNSALGYSSQPLAEAKLDVNIKTFAEQFKKASNAQDTLVISARLDDDLFGSRLYTYAITEDITNQAALRQFIYAFKGFALVPSESNSVLGLRVLDNLSNVTVHYHSIEGGLVKDTLTRAFVFNYSSFTNITNDRSTTEFGSLSQDYKSQALPSGLRMVQSGDPVITKLDVSNFYNFSKSVGQIQINSAEIVIENVESPIGYSPHSSLMLKVMKPGDDDKLANLRALADREALTTFMYKLPSPSGFILSDENHYFVLSDVSALSSPSISSISYSAENKKYSGFMTLFFQSLYTNRDKEDNLRYLSLNPLAPAIGSSVSRTVFNENNIKLRVYYTELSQENPE